MPNDSSLDISSELGDLQADMDQMAAINEQLEARKRAREVEKQKNKDKEQDRLDKENNQTSPGKDEQKKPSHEEGDTPENNSAPEADDSENPKGDTEGEQDLGDDASGQNESEQQGDSREENKGKRGKNKGASKPEVAPVLMNQHAKKIWIAPTWKVDAEKAKLIDKIFDNHRSAGVGYRYKQDLVDTALEWLIKEHKKFC